MTVYGYRGQVVHMNNCTYCSHRLNVLMTARKGQKPPIQERCALDRHILPPPTSIDRFCEHYKQNGCECDICTPEE